MKLDGLLKSLEVLYVDGKTDIEITQIIDDSRKTKEGSLFIAVDGFTVDGHDYVFTAIENGAKAIVISKDIKNLKKVCKSHGITVIKVKDTRPVLAQVASRFYDEPSKKLELIGVTGTNGKTSTTYFIEAIFEEAGRSVGVIGSIGNIINKKLWQTKNTTPESLEIQELLDRMVNTNIDTCVIETSSHALELHRVDFCNFDVGVFTNLTSDHLDYHKNIENYFNAKLKLFHLTKKHNIINIDDEYGMRIIKNIEELNTQVVTYGLNNSANIYATDLKYSSKGVCYTLNTPKGSVEIKTNIPGEFTVYNSLAAACCGYVYDIELDTIKDGIESIPGIKGRFEVVPTDEDFTVIIDFANTSDSLEKALQTVRQFSDGRVVVVFGAGGNRDRSKRPIMGEIAAMNSDFCVVTSDNPRDEDPLKIIEEVIEGVKKVDCEYVVIVDRKEAIRYALKNCRPNDVILLAGKGHETYTIIGDQVLPFDEKRIIQDILKEKDNC